MRVAIPLGQVEGQRLEFKGRDALKKPQLLSRAVVAMLNADGGEVWVGLREEAGHAVQIEAIADARSETGRLWNHLIDTIDPPPQSGEKGEIEVEAVLASEDKEVLRIRVTPGERGPYAQLKDGGRFFFIRAGDRLRSMTREEIAQGFQAETRTASKAGSASSKALESLRDERERLLKLGKPLFWIRLQPEEDLDLDLQFKGLDRLLVEPAASSNRPSGWMVVNPYLQPKLRGSALAIEHPEFGATRILRSGAVEFCGPLENLWHSRDPRHYLHPYALLELPVSLVRVGARVFSMSDARKAIAGRGSNRKPGRQLVFADLGLFEVQGWRLMPYSPLAYGYRAKHAEAAFAERSLVLERELAFDMDEIVSEPDRCAFRLIRQVYQAFGYTEDQIPSEFDRKSGKLRIGDG